MEVFRLLLFPVLCVVLCCVVSYCVVLRYRNCEHDLNVSARFGFGAVITSPGGPSIQLYGCRWPPSKDM